MKIIGEKINASRGPIASALEARDVKLIAGAAIEQVRAGADYIDVNGGDPDPRREAQNVAWLIEVVQGATEAPVSIDSVDPQAMRTGLELARKKPILNSISLESRRLEGMLPLLGEHDCMAIGLLISDAGPPRGTDDRLQRASALIDTLVRAGKRMDDIIIDPGFFPISVDSRAARAAIEAIQAIRRNWPEVHICGGVSNASYGLPERRYVNLALTVLAIFAGMDYAIIDPCVPGTAGLIAAAEALAGNDESCRAYIAAAREGRLS